MLCTGKMGLSGFVLEPCCELTLAKKEKASASKAVMINYFAKVYCNLSSC